MTPRVKVFLIISGLLYAFFSLSIIGLEIATIIDSSWTFYRGLWSGGFLLAAGTGLLVIACHRSYLVWQLTQFFVFGLLICIIGLILSAVNFCKSLRCEVSFSRYQCDNGTILILKMAVLILLGLATIQTALSLVITTRLQKKALSSPSADIISLS